MLEINLDYVKKSEQWSNLLLLFLLNFSVIINHIVCYNYNGDGMKDVIKIIVMFSIVILIYIFRNNISTFVENEIIYGGSNRVLSYNEYYLNNDYSFVQNTDSGEAKTYNELINMFYSIINSGDDNYSFYCKYSNCTNDVQNLISEQNTIANINNFVHPYNSFQSINIEVGANGRITIKTKKVYSKKQIDYINNYIEEFKNNNLNDSMTTSDKIKVFHDYIINNTVYDTEAKDESYTAYNLITTGKSICGGYSDIMAIYLNNLGVKNYKITSPNHVWNLVYVDGIWYHIDATWDDPITNDNKQYLIHNFYMITTEELFKLDTVEHNFDKTVFVEAN